jgi:hypothetical protein
MRILVTVIATIIVLALSALGLLFSGIYNVAATDPHSELGAWVLSTAMRRSVEYHASAQPVDARLAQQDTKQGFAEFNETWCPMPRGSGEGPRQNRKRAPASGAKPEVRIRALDGCSAVLDHQIRRQNDGDARVRRDS